MDWPALDGRTGFDREQSASSLHDGGRFHLLILIIGGGRVQSAPNEY